MARIGPVKPVRKTTPFKAGKIATNKPPVGKGVLNKVGKPVAAKPVRKGEVLNPRAVAAKKKALELVANKQLVDVKNKKLIDMKKERLSRVTSVKAKKIVEKKAARKSLGGGTSRRASY